MQEKLYAAVDLGGTKIYAVLAENCGRILSSVRYDTQLDQGPEGILEQMAISVREVLAQAGAGSDRLSAVGVCLAGFFDWQRRVLIHSPNIPGLDQIRMEERLSEKLRVPVLAENDANAAAIGEARCGAAAGSQDVLYITVSTGIGAGLVLGGQIYRGTRGFAGEAGHMVVKPDGFLCGCGRRGCLETVASGTAIARAANEVLQSGKATLLRELSRQQGGTVNTATVFRAARDGDKPAQEIISAAIYYLGIALVNLVNMLNPEIVVIGGGVSAAGEDLFVPLEKAIQNFAIPPAAASVTLKQAILGVEAGVTGMLCLLTEAERIREG
ncbi:MAG: ROK family protein [Dethiobacter sp.]|jgi:glucokinase|nr:ROK family protein [Dethiobacter sp.]MBS3989696.1 ROK family protein [Dethiobacter sp.]